MELNEQKRNLQSNNELLNHEIALKLKELQTI